MATRPKRSMARKNYKELSDLQLPRVKRPRTEHNNKPHSEEPDGELYRLEIIEEDHARDRVRVRYVGYEGDEWRPRMKL